MAKVFNWIVRHPGWFIVLYSVLLAAAWGAPTFLMFRPIPWTHGWEWARVVLQIGALLLVLLGGLVPIARWYEDRVHRIIDQKPIVVTNRLFDGSHEIRNIGSAPAINVWLVIMSRPAPIGLGALDAHETRVLPDSVVDIVNQDPSGKHILLAANRYRIASPHERRPYTVTFNVRATETTFCHGFDDNPPMTRLTRSGTVHEYLSFEHADLLSRLNAFVAKVKPDGEKGGA